MAGIHDQLSAQFYQWEMRGRGWQVYDKPVAPEPPFRSFDGYFQPRQPDFDDGRRPTALSSFVERLRRKLSTEPPPATDTPTEAEEPEPKLLIRDSLVELQTSLPADLS